MYICTRWWKSFSIFLRLQCKAILDSDVYVLRPCVFIKFLKPGILYPANDANGCSSCSGHAVWCTASSHVPKSVYCTTAAASDCPYNGRVCTTAASSEALFPYDGVYILSLSVCLMIGCLLTAFLTQISILHRSRSYRLPLQWEGMHRSSLIRGPIPLWWCVHSSSFCLSDDRMCLSDPILNNLLSDWLSARYLSICVDFHRQLRPCQHLLGMVRPCKHTSRGMLRHHSTLCQGRQITPLTSMPPPAVS